MTLIYGQETLLSPDNLLEWIRKGYTICGKYNVYFWRYLAMYFLIEKWCRFSK